MTNLDTLAIARDRKLGLEAHRVLRCVEQALSFEAFEPVDVGAMARMLEMRPQAISRALRILTERGIIVRGASLGRASTFRFSDTIAALAAADVDALLRLAQDNDLERLVRGGTFSPGYGRDELRKDIAAGRCWVLVADGTIVGQLAIRKDPSIDMAYLVARLMVDGCYRRRGLGRRLLGAMERSLEGNRIHAHCPVSDPVFLRFLIDADFALSGYVKGRDEYETRLFFSKLACASETARAASRPAAAV